MPAPPPPLVIANLLLRTGERVLFSNLNLQLAPGTLTLLQGPSGSGKSTLLRTLVRLHSDYQGEITLWGRSLHTIPPPELRRRAAFIPQQPVLFPGNVEQNLLLPFTFHGCRKNPPPREELETALDLVGLSPRMLEASAADLSGGEAQRVALLRSLLPGPALLLLDEPAAALDGESAQLLVKAVTSWILDIPGERTALWVSHHPGELGDFPAQKLFLTSRGLEEVFPK